MCKSQGVNFLLPNEIGDKLFASPQVHSNKLGAIVCNQALNDVILCSLQKKIINETQNATKVRCMQ